MNARTAARRTGALVGVLALAAAVAGASVLAGPVDPAPATTRPLPLTARAATTVCPGPETLLVPEGADPLAPGGPVTVRGVLAGAGGGSGAAGAVEGGLLRLGAATATTALNAQGSGDAARLGVGDLDLTAAGGVAVEARTPAGAAAPLTGGVQSTLAREGDVRGLVATTCGAVAEETWLVGSGTGPGRRGRLLLSNPTPATATVDVRVLTPDGPVDPANGQGVVVPAASQVALLLDALVPDARSVAVRVLAREGRVVATLHDSLLRGLVAGGADDVAPAAAPATRQVVPGLPVVASPTEDGPARLPADAGDPGAVAVRVAVPGTEDAIVRVSVLGPDGSSQLPAGVVDLPAGSVADVPVTGVADGAWTAVVDSDVPVVAGAVVGRAVARSELAGTPDGVAAQVPPAELAWAAATAPLSRSVVALPAGVGARLLMAAPDADASVRITPVTADGRLAASDVAEVPAGRTVSVELPSAAAAVLLEPSGGAVHAAVTLEVADPAGPLLSVLPVDPPVASAQSRLPVVEDPGLG